MTMTSACVRLLLAISMFAMSLAAGCSHRKGAALAEGWYSGKAFTFMEEGATGYMWCVSNEVWVVNLMTSEPVWAAKIGEYRVLNGGVLEVQLGSNVACGSATCYTGRVLDAGIQWENTDWQQSFSKEPFVRRVPSPIPAETAFRIRQQERRGKRESARDEHRAPSAGSDIKRASGTFIEEA